VIINQFAAIPEGHDQLVALGTEDEARLLSGCLRGLGFTCLVGTLPTTGDWISIFVPDRLMGRARLVLDGFRAGQATRG
jgi:hypothetical protein